MLMINKFDLVVLTYANFLLKVVNRPNNPYNLHKFN